MTRRRIRNAVWALALASVIAAGCATLPWPLPAPEESGAVWLPPHELPLFADDSDRTSLLHAVDRSLDQLARLPDERASNVAGRQVTVADLRRTLEILRAAVVSAPAPIDWTGLVRDRFEILRTLPDTPLLVTGYYEPELTASRERTDRFRHPLYRLPDDLVDIDLGQFCAACAGTVRAGRVTGRDFVPYPSRRQIDAEGALIGREAELAWLDDPVEVFFLHVQGSGVLRFADGSAMRVSFAGSNGRPYRSLGKMLVERGDIPLERVSLQSLKDYLRAHPGERDDLLYANERYIFFRPVPVGPIGSFNVPLTPGRSLAVDPNAYPLGSLLFLRSERPGESGATLPLARFVCAQDTGAAITGPARADLFWGTGSAAARIAGPMRSGGALYLLLAR